MFSKSVLKSKKCKLVGGGEYGIKKKKELLMYNLCDLEGSHKKVTIEDSSGYSQQSFDLLTQYGTIESNFGFVFKT